MIGVLNIDLLSVGIATAATGVIGFVVFFSNKNSTTNRTFLYFSIVTILWSIVNYLNYQSIDQSYGLLLIRLTVFLGLFHSTFFYQLFTVFPEEKFSFPKFHKYVLLPLILIVGVLIFTPLIFHNVVSTGDNGRITEIKNGPLIPLFGATVMFLVISGIVKLIKKMRKATDILKRQYRNIFVGTLMTFSLLIIFNFIFPAFLNNPKYIPLGAVFLFPFIIFTSYAILKHRLFSVKVVSTAILVFAISVALIIDIIYASNLSSIILRSSIFLLVLIFGISLIRSVLREVEQREKLEILDKQLESANEKLKGLDKLKTEFLSLASHQLRSPLTAIKGYASMLYEGSFGAMSDKQVEGAKRIYTSAQGLTNIVEDLLNVTKIEQGGMKYEFIATDLGKLVQDLYVEMKIPAESKHLEFTLDLPSDDVFMISADPVKLKQVFLNLVDNSIKYTQSGFIHLTLKRDSTNIIFRVSDSGAGITPEVKAKLFEKFSRGDSAGTNTGGSGLGLYLAREIARAHKGEVVIDSEGLGKGSTFTVILPATGLPR